MKKGNDIFDLFVEALKKEAEEQLEVLDKTARGQVPIDTGGLRGGADFAELGSRDIGKAVKVDSKGNVVDEKLIVNVELLETPKWEGGQDEG